MEMWTTRELPVLRALVEQFDDPDTLQVRPEQLSQADGLTADDVNRALRALSEARPPYIEGVMPDQYSYPVIITGVTERARRATGLWPASDQAVDVLVAALQSAGETDPDPDRRSGFRKAAAFLGGSGKEVLYRVLTQLSSQEAGQYLPHVHH
jgi:hypothetical protein